MSIDSVAAVGLLGVQKGMQGAASSASAIANAGQASYTDMRSMTEALVTLKQSEQQVAASAKTIKAADDMIGTLIDVLA
jgi:hypothetical protein